jgi:hypothetical protein
LRSESCQSGPFAPYRAGFGLTPMDDVVLVQIVDSAQNLLDGLRRILLGKLALLADSVEQLSSRRKLGDDVVLVLQREARRLVFCRGFWRMCASERRRTYP